MRGLIDSYDRIFRVLMRAFYRLASPVLGIREIQCVCVFRSGETLFGFTTRNGHKSVINFDEDPRSLYINARFLGILSNIGLLYCA